MRKERRYLLVNRGTADQVRSGIGGLGITQLYPIKLQPYKMGRLERLKLSTFGLEIQSSIQLSYSRIGVRLY